MTDMKKAEELETVKTAMEHMNRMRHKSEEVVFMFQDGGPIMWTAAGPVNKTRANHSN